MVFKNNIFKNTERGPEHNGPVLKSNEEINIFKIKKFCKICKICG
jgi:hypothetical protein